MSLSLIERKRTRGFAGGHDRRHGPREAGRRDCSRRSKSDSLRGTAKSRRPRLATRRSRFSPFRRRATAKAQTTVYFQKDNLLVGIDDRAEAEAMLKRFAGSATDNLKSLPAYQATMERCHREAGSLEPEARWFIDPFGFIFAGRTLRTQRQARPGHGEDSVRQRLRRDQGRRRLCQPIGGWPRRVLARAAVYAPAVEGKENDPLRWT